MVKKRKLGTGTTTDDSGTRKWVAGVRSQADNSAQPGINARYVPLAQIVLDPLNPRRLSITPEEVAEISRAVPLQRQWLEGEGSKEWWDDFAHEIKQHLAGKSYTDYLDLVLLALSIKSHDRLLHPVTVYSDDGGSRLHLITGERRYLAHLILGEPSLAARILSQRPEGLEKDVLQWEENNQRLGLSLPEQLVSLKRLVSGWEKQQSRRLSVSQMVALVGVPRVTAHRYLTVLRCRHKGLMAAIEEGQIGSLRKASEMAALSKVELQAALNNKPAQTPTQSVVKIRRAQDYTPIQQILRAAATELASKTFVKEISRLELDTAAGVAEGFDRLVKYLEKRPKKP